MHPRLTLQYRSARTTVDSILGPAGTTSRGHEFHRTRTAPGAGLTAAWAHDDGVEGWLKRPRHQLGDRSPQELLDDGEDDTVLAMALALRRSA